MSLTFLLYLWLLPAASAQTATYIVHMDSSAMPAAFSGLHCWYTATLSTAKDNIVYVYDNSIHGFSARLSSSQLEDLEKTHGFLSAYPDKPIKVADTTHTFDFLGLSEASGIWPASNYGQDVIVGVIDSGVWPESQSYRDDGMTQVPTRWKGECEEGTYFNSSACNRKLIGARYFNKGLLADKPNVAITVNSPRDTDGHGTHTSSTAVGNYAGSAGFFGYATGTARGVAPCARLAVYKVMWNEGAYLSDIMAGVDKAISDGVDVISISLGMDGAPLDKDPIAIAAFAAMEKGIVVAASTGNEGPWVQSLHNGAPWLLTVGASTIDREFAGVVELGNGTTIAGQSLYSGNPSSLKQLPLVFISACDNKTLLQNVGYKIVVCESNGTLSSEIDTVASTPVAGGLFITSTPYIDYNVHFTFPGEMLDTKDGQIVLEYMNNTPNPTANLNFQETILGTKPAPMVATYTSRGPSPSSPAVLKPDIVAPGSLVLASWPPNSSVMVVGSRNMYSQFNIISGSSMACPHAAGVAALLKAAHPDWSPAAIRSAMMTTADVLDNNLEPIKDMGTNYMPAIPLAMGSGHINPNKALSPGLIYDAGAEDYIRLLCAMEYTNEQIQTITRSPNFDCSNSSLDLNYPSFIAFFDTGKPSTVREFRRTVTNVEDGMWRYSAKVTDMEGFAVSVVPEVLVFREKNEKQSFVLRLECSVVLEENIVVDGWLSWVDDQGKHVVRSPIVATTLSSEPL